MTTTAPEFNAPLIPDLIVGRDSYEIIRDTVFNILATETASQQIRAAALGYDPTEWEVSVHKERSNPWEDYLNDPDNVTPIINVWYDNTNFDKARSNIVERQGATATINVDIIAVGYGEEIDGGGQILGDVKASENAQRTLRLARNILMAAPYTYLGLRGLVGQRWVESINMMQPKKDDNAAQSIIGARLVLVVQFNEFSPQFQTVDLEQLGVTVTRSETGETLAQVDFNYGE